MNQSRTLRNESDRAAAVRLIQSINLDEPKSLRLTDKVPTRNDAQNSLMWVWNGQWGFVTGHTKNEIHDENKRRIMLPLMMQYPNDYPHAPWVYRLIEQHPTQWAALSKFVSSTDLSVKHFAEYLTQMEHEATSLGIQLTNTSDEYFWAVYGAKKRGGGNV